jgi:hypothetical protein
VLKSEASRTSYIEHALSPVTVTLAIGRLTCFSVVVCFADLVPPVVMALAQLKQQKQIWHLGELQHYLKGVDLLPLCKPNAGRLYSVGFRASVTSKVRAAKRSSTIYEFITELE